MKVLARFKVNESGCLVARERDLTATSPSNGSLGSASGACNRHQYEGRVQQADRSTAVVVGSIGGGILGVIIVLIVSAVSA